MNSKRLISLAAALGLFLGTAAWAQDLFIRGDLNNDGRVTISDAAFIANTFLPDKIPVFCSKTADSNDNGKIEISDAKELILWAAGLGSPPPAPWPDPGPDPNPDALPCNPVAIRSREPDPAYKMNWSYPEKVQRGQKGIEVFLQATTAAPVDGFSMSYMFNTMAADIQGIDFTNTIFPADDQAAFQQSSYFKWNIIPTLIPEASIVTASAVFVRDNPQPSALNPLERLSFSATEGPLSKAPLLRVVLDIRKDAPLVFGKTRMLWPSGDAAGVDSGTINEYSVQGIAHPPGEEGEVPFWIIDAGEFMRSDANNDMRYDISDSIYIFGYLFLGTADPTCLKALDVDDNSKIDLNDGVYSLRFYFMGGPEPMQPYDPLYDLEKCAEDPTEDGLTCFESVCTRTQG